MSKKIIKSSLNPEKILPVRLLIMDVDGVLTDGRITFTANGDEVKSFNCKDGQGLNFWMRSGRRAGIITGRKSAMVERRAKELGIEFLAQGTLEKVPAFEAMIAEAGVSPEEVAMIGDDIPDLPLIRRAGFGAAVGDAVDEVKDAAEYVTEQKGGYGAVREVIELILKHQGGWDALVERY